jgi:hypothetical protein
MKFLKVRLSIKFHVKYTIVIIFPDAPVSPVVTGQTKKRPQKKDRKVIQISEILFREIRLKFHLIQITSSPSSIFK